MDDNKFNIDNKIDYQPNISDPKAFNLTNNKMLNLNFETLNGECKNHMMKILIIHSIRILQQIMQHKTMKYYQIINY